MKIYNVSTTKVGSRNNKASINIIKAGAIYFSKRLSEILNLKTDDRIEFLNDEENPKDWFIRKNKNGFRVRNIKNTDAYALNSAYITREIIKSLDLYGNKSISFQVAEKTTTIKGYGEWYAIITSNPLNIPQNEIK